MKIRATILVLLLGLGAAQSKSRKQKSMEQETKMVIESFVEAIAERDIDVLDSLLHDDFRVIANQFKGADKTLILPKTAYLKMIEEGKIGGDPYTLKILNSSVFKHTAMIQADLVHKEKPNMHIFFVLVQGLSGNWKIASDTPVLYVD